LHENCRYAEAQQNFLTAIGINPKFAEAHYRLAVLLMDPAATKLLSSGKAKPQAKPAAKRTRTTKTAKKKAPKKSRATAKKPTPSKRK
jgi:hypothetical protein